METDNRYIAEFKTEIVGLGSGIGIHHFDLNVSLLLCPNNQRWSARFGCCGAV